MKKTRQQIRMWVAAALAVFGSAIANADAVDEILKQSDVQLNLGSGNARGKVLGRQGDSLRMKLGEVEYQVAVDQITDSPQAFHDQAVRLAGSGKFRRAAVQYGLARLLAPELADSALENQILGGLGQEKTSIQKFRKERIQNERQSFESSALGGLSKTFPALNAFVTTQSPLLPKNSPAAPAVLNEWQSAVMRNNDHWAKFRAIRDSNAPADQRLNELQALVRTIPAPEKLREQMKVDLKRLDSIISLFVYADANLWIDRLQFEQTQKEFQQFKSSFTPAIDTARQQARELLLEQLVPTKRVERVKRGNLFEERVVPVQRDMIAVEQLQGRLNAPFAEERRADSGMYFTTTMGDEVFVPVSDWSAFDNPRKLAPTPEEEFLQRDRPGLKNFLNGIRELTMAWGADTNDLDRITALRVLQQEAVSMYGSPVPAPKTAKATTAPSQPQVVQDL